MNAEESPGRKKPYQHQMQVILGRITALESQWEFSKAQAYTKLRDNWIVRANDIMIVEEADYETVETWGGESRKVQTGIEAPISLTWIDYHDRLVKEWFDGERKLVDDLYPEPEKPAQTKDPVFGPLMGGVVLAACYALVALPIVGVIVLLVWLAKMVFVV
jgi:hypothetical protein